MKPNEKNYDEATDWLARLRASDVSNTDRENFALWLIRDSANKPAFDAMLRIWEDLGVVSQFASSDFTTPKYAYSTESSSSVREPERVPLKRYYTPLALAATLVFALAALFVIQNTQLEYSTEAGQLKLVTLKDGSQVKLNSSSSISVRYTK